MHRLVEAAPLLTKLMDVEVVEARERLLLLSFPRCNTRYRLLAVSIDASLVRIHKL